MSDGGMLVSLPPGVTIAPGRETTQVGPGNVPIQGMQFTLTLANGAQTSVFVPYSIMANVAQVQQMFADRVAAINAVTALGS